MTSEKKPRELWVNPARLNDWMDPNTGLYAASDCPKPGHIHVREVIEPDETPMHTLLSKQKTQYEAEIAKLREALKVAMGCINEVEMHFALIKNDIALKEINIVQTRIQSIMGEKEGEE